MCLEFKGDFRSCSVGYKLLGVTPENELVTYMKGEQRAIPKGVWIHERDYRTFLPFGKERLSFEDDGGEYPYGWHIFHTLEGVRRFLSEYRWPIKSRHESRDPVIVKVKVRKAHTTGSKGGCRCTVSTEMCVLNIVKPRVKP